MKFNKNFTKVLALAIPAALKHLIDILQVLVDMIMVGKIGIASLGAVGMAMQFLMFFNVFMTLYIVGSNALIARYIGSGRKNRSSRVLFSVFLFVIALSSSLAILLYPWSYELYTFMGASKEIALEGKAYFSVILLGLPLLFIDNLLYNSLSAAGDTKSSLYIKLFSTVLNGFGNYIFIFGHFCFEPMGVKGAAISTLISYGFNVIAYILLLFLKKNSVLNFFGRFSFEDLKKSLRIGYPAAIDRGISVVSFLFFVSIIAKYGSTELAAYQVGLRIEGIAFMPGFGFAIAAMALVGQSLGAKKTQQAYEMGMLATKTAAFFMGSVGIGMIAFGEELASFFTQDQKTIQLASSYLYWVGLAQVPLAFSFVFSASLRSATHTKLVMKINLACLWFLRVIPSYIAYKFHLEIIAIFIIMNIETLVKGVIFLQVYRTKTWLKGIKWRQ